MELVYTKGLAPCKIVNVVSKYELGCTLNLTKILLEKRGTPAKYNPTCFAAFIMNPSSKTTGTTTALLFDTGNVVHTGSKTEDHAREAAHEEVCFLNKHLGTPASVNNFQITNMVSEQ